MTDSFQTYPTAETPRLLLRPLGQADAPAVHAITDDPVVRAAIERFNPVFTLADTEALLARWNGGDDVMIGAWRKADAALTGVVGLHLRPGDEVEVGYWFGSAFHGQGYAGEAVGAVVRGGRAHLPHRRMFAECLPTNRASWRLLEKTGFRDAGEEAVRPGRKRLVLA